MVPYHIISYQTSSHAPADEHEGRVARHVILYYVKLYDTTLYITTLYHYHAKLYYTPSHAPADEHEGRVARDGEPLAADELVLLAVDRSHLCTNTCYIMLYYICIHYIISYCTTSKGNIGERRKEEGEGSG
jgi:hypothetical protein